MSVRDAEGRPRRCVYLPAECWEWLEATAKRDAGVERARADRPGVKPSGVSDLLEGLVLLAMDADEPDHNLPGIGALDRRRRARGLS